MQGLLDASLMQNLQNRFCEANNVYLVCLSRERGVVTKAYGEKEELEYIHSIVNKNMHMSLMNKLLDQGIENVLEEDCGTDLVKMCGVSIRAGGKTEAIWIVIGIMEQPDTSVPSYIMRTTPERYYKSIRFLETLSKQMFAVKMEEMLAQEAFLKSRESEQQRRIAEKSLADSYASLEAVLENVGCGVCVRDPESGQILYTNQRFQGHLPESMTNTLLEPYRVREKKEDGGEYFREVYDEKTGRWFDLQRTPIRWVDGREVRLSTIYDVTDKKLYQQKIEKQANNDFLTGLYNRRRCERDLACYIREAEAGGSEGALLYIDLDDFKHINDGLGHQYGDILLKKIADSLGGIPELRHHCYRMGGDEFVAILTAEGNQRLPEILEKVTELFSSPWQLKNADYYCTMSMGIVQFPRDGSTVEELIQKVDIALYEAKRAGKNRIEFYDSRIKSTSFERLDVEKRLRDALANDCKEFEVIYQPIVNVEGELDHCVGAEALLRWNCGALGVISPTEFVPLAEYLGLINPIGESVLREACRSCKYWNDLGHPEYKVNVNLSVVQLLQKDIVDTVQKIVEESGISPGNLTLEVTEGLAVNDMVRMKRVLAGIRALGVRVALDDFGTGYSSLNHIREMPLDVIKIDSCFVADIGKDEFQKAFVTMVAELAHAIGVRVCVEGVETVQQLAALKKTKIQMIQGFYFGKPMDRAAFEKKYL